MDDAFPGCGASDPEKTEAESEVTTTMAQEGQKRSVRTPLLEKYALCPVCGRSFNLARSTHKFCSPSCRKRAWDRKQILTIVVESLKKTIAELS
jgi:hypothetical protein